MTIKTPHIKASKSSAINLPTLVSGTLVLLPAAFSFVLLYLLRLPFPYQDDFKALLAFAVQYSNASDVAAKVLKIAVINYGPYHLIFQHLVVATEVELTHYVNFSFLTMLGDLFLVGIAIFLWLSFGREPLRTKLLYFSPVSLLFFGLTYWETLNWAMAALQNLPVIFFALVALYFLVPRNTPAPVNYRFSIACSAACLSCCSSANGFLLAPVGAIMLVSRRWYTHASFWLLSFVLPFWAYGYKTTESPMHYSFHLKQILYFVAFFGGAFPERIVAFVLGASLLTTLVWVARSHLTRQSPVLFLLSVWIVLTGALVEAVRSSLASRYSIYSVLLLICCYRFLLNALDQKSLESTRLLGFEITRKHFLRFAIAFSLLFYLQADINAYHGLHERREMVVAGFKHYLLNPDMNSPQVNPGVDKLFPDETPFELYMLKQVAHEHLYTVPSEQQLQQY
jgi:hypothetical protein